MGRDGRPKYSYQSKLQRRTTLLFFFCLLEGYLLAILLVALILHLFSPSSLIRGRLTNDDEWYFWVSLFALG